MSEPTGNPNAESIRSPEILDTEAVNAAIKKMELAMSEGGETVVDEQQKRNVIMPAFAEIMPELSPEERESFLTAATSLDDLGKKTSLSDEEASSFANSLSGLNSVQREEAVNMTKLDPDSKEKVLSHSEEVPDEEKTQEKTKDHNVSEPEAKRMGARIEALRNLFSKKHSEAEHEIHHKDTLPHHVKEIMKEKLEEKMEMFNDWLHPDEPAKEWVSRAGKTVFVLAVAAALLVIFEMSLIHKAAGGK